jgi:hypothetical protein
MAYGPRPSTKPRCVSNGTSPYGCAKRSPKKPGLRRINRDEPGTSRAATTRDRAKSLFLFARVVAQCKGSSPNGVTTVRRRRRSVTEVAEASLLRPDSDTPHTRLVVAPKVPSRKVLRAAAELARRSRGTGQIASTARIGDAGRAAPWRLLTGLALAALEEGGALALALTLQEGLESGRRSILILGAGGRVGGLFIVAHGGRTLTDPRPRNSSFPARTVSPAGSSPDGDRAAEREGPSPERRAAGALGRRAWPERVTQGAIARSCGVRASTKWCPLAVLAALATGSACGDSAPEAPDGGAIDAVAADARLTEDGVPTEATALQAYLVAGGYRSWTAESGPHPSAGPHGGRVRTYLSPGLARSLAQGGAHPKDAVAIKELYGSGSSVSGWAVEIKLSDSSNAGRGWYWYEVFSAQPGAKAATAGVGVSLCTGCHSAGRDYVQTPFPLQ